MIHQSWTSFLGEEQESSSHHDQAAVNSLTGHVGFSLDDNDQEGSITKLSAVACDIAERVGGVAMDYFHAFGDNDGEEIPQHEESECNDTHREHHAATPPRNWKRYVSAQVNRIRVDLLPSIPMMEANTSDHDTHEENDSGFCKSVYELPV